jgi:hypothetical protein
MIDKVEKIYVSISKNSTPKFTCFKVNYKVVENGVTFQVPLNEANVDYQAIQEWAKIEGNNIIDPGA